MPELRWILLVVGVLFIAGLLMRDRLRKRAPARAADSADDTRDAYTAPVAPSVRSGRTAPVDLPIIQVDRNSSIDVSFASTRPQAPSQPQPAAALAPKQSARPQPQPSADSGADLAEWVQAPADTRPHADVPAPGASIVDAPAAVAPAAVAPTAVAPGVRDDFGEAFEDDVGPVRELGADEASDWQPPETGPVLSGAELRLEWPEEGERRIIALRVMPRGREKLLGRAVRQALSGAGLLHGPMDIFHFPCEDGRVVFSAASLTKPGMFRLADMDSERYAGLNLFAVLPGPLSPAEALDCLYGAARDVADRLDADLLDQQGAALTASRIEALREQYAESHA